METILIMLMVVNGALQFGTTHYETPAACIEANGIIRTDFKDLNDSDKVMENGVMIAKCFPEDLDQDDEEAYLYIGAFSNGIYYHHMAEIESFHACELIPQRLFYPLKNLIVDQGNNGWVSRLTCIGRGVEPEDDDDDRKDRR